MAAPRPLCVPILLALLLFVPMPAGAGVPLGGLAVAVTEDGSRLVAGGDTRALYDLDPVTLAVKRRVHLGRAIVDLAFSKDGKRLVVESTKAIHILDGASLAAVKTLEKYERMSVAAGAGLLAVMDRRAGMIRVLAMQDGSEKAALDYDRMKSVAAFGLSPDGRRVALLYNRRKDESEAKVAYKEIPKDLKGAALNEFKQRNDGYKARFRLFDVATGKTTLDTKLWYGAPGGGNRVFFHGGHVYVVGYENQNARIDAQGEAGYFELGNGYNYGMAASSDHAVFLTGGLRDGSRTAAGDLQGAAFRLDDLPGFPEYFRSFSLAADGTGFGGTTGYRVVRFKPDGTIEKTAPVF